MCLFQFLRSNEAHHGSFIFKAVYAQIKVLIEFLLFISDLLLKKDLFNTPLLQLEECKYLVSIQTDISGII